MPRGLAEGPEALGVGLASVTGCEDKPPASGDQERRLWGHQLELATSVGV